MCGIFGVVFGRDERITTSFAGQGIEKLYRCSQTRGSEAAGLAVHHGAGIEVLKQAGTVDRFLENPRYIEILRGALEKYARNLAADAPVRLAMIGHTRLVTNGFQSNVDNNQPVVARGTVGIHNGIIVNDEELWTRHRELVRESEVDTEVLVSLVRSDFDRTGDLAGATQRAFAEIQGAASVAFLFDSLDALLLATNTGSLHVLTNERRTFLAFASERFILQRLERELDLGKRLGAVRIEPIPAFEGRIVSLRDLSVQAIPIVPANGRAAAAPELPRRAAPAPIVDHTKTPAKLRRCTRCILPESYPFMEFDEHGVCTYCRRWRPIQPKGEEALRRAVEPYRSKDGSPDVIVAFSGGRDSAYGLHYVKKVLGMNPVAFTYDWGMVTDLGRRNQARICGKLGVEHILRSADLPKKRRYIRKNVEAWLKKPELGMVTLFTAGDKQFYHYARQLRKETGIKLVVFCTGNMIEDTPYKTGLCGILEDDHEMTLTGLSFRNELALLWYYAKNYLKNPAYINDSLWDTLWAYWATFVEKDDFLYLYHYVPWSEDEIVGTIRREYDWEVAQDTKSTWRIGDGTAAWYNYIYQTIAGWSEDEVMLSNMIREKHLSRAEAVLRAAEYGAPRWPSIREYAQLVGFNCEEALTIINGTPKVY
jgi:glucosamine--fructose-6-phosphate aminotransferase (isomerizing)